MTNRANIFYDHEIEELVRSRSVTLLPMITYMFAQYPQGSLEDIFYTIENHVLQNGMETYPEYLLPAPAPAYEPVVEVVEEIVREEPQVEPEEETPVEVSEEKATSTERRNIQRRAVVEKPHEKLNVRGIMDDLKDLDL